MALRTGCSVRNPYRHAEVEVRWSGDRDAQGRATGSGVLEWRYKGKTSRFRGEVREGAPNGRGVQTWPGGNRYAGYFRLGQPDGFGVCLTEGSRIEGEWDNGCMRKGLLVFAVGKPASQCR